MHGYHNVMIVQYTSNFKIQHFMQIQDDDKDQRILTLNKKIVQLEKELTESKSCATSYSKENLLLVKRCFDLKESLMKQFVKIQNLEYSLCDLHESASKQAFSRENKGTQTDLVGIFFSWIYCCLIYIDLLWL